jgi:hypothetical protein
MFINYLAIDWLKMPLYLDTVFTAAMCFAGGLLPGILTALFTFLLNPLKYVYLLGLPVETAWSAGFFVICVLVEVLLVCFFHAKIRSREAVFLAKPSPHTFISVASRLLVLSALACIAVSISGGIIDFFYTLSSAPRTFHPEDTFKLGLLRNHVPLLATAILSRIPINIVDRFFVIFGGYCISLLYRKWLGTSQSG